MSETEAPTIQQPQHVRAAERSDTVPLDWPIVFNGATYSAITVRRPTVADLAAYFARVRAVQAAGGNATSLPLPMYDAPDEVLGALDPDDDERVDEVTKRFLPRRFRDGPA